MKMKSLIPKDITYITFDVLYPPGVSAGESVLQYLWSHPWQRQLLTNMVVSHNTLLAKSWGKSGNLEGSDPFKLQMVSGKGGCGEFPISNQACWGRGYHVYFQHVYIKSSVVTRCTNIVFPLPVGNLFQSSHSPLVICLDPCLAGHHLRMPKVRGNAWRVRGKFIKKKGGAAGIVSHI